MSQSPDPDAAARNALRLIGPDPQNWVPDRTGIDHNVAIVGGGQSGCAFAFALRRAGIGVAGNGGPYVPPVLSEGLPPRLYAHTADAIDFAALRGKAVAVVGGAASAFDAAAVALENGAGCVHLFARGLASPRSRFREC